MDTFVPIPDYDGYFINKNGDVLSKKRYKEGRLLKPRMKRDGYYCVCLMKDKMKHMRLHRLIALTFISNADNLPCVDHIDRNVKNNSLSNLRWCTHITNSQNRTRNKNNKLGHKNINFYIDKRDDTEWYKFTIVRNGKTHQKQFKTLEEAIKYRDEYLKNLGEEIID